MTKRTLNTVCMALFACIASPAFADYNSSSGNYYPNNSQNYPGNYSNNAYLPNGPSTTSPVQNPPPGNSGYGNQNQVSSQVQWYTDYSQALQVAQKQNKPILLFFTGSDWCGWCKKLDSEVFNSPDFARSAGNSFVFVEIDFPRSQKFPPAQVEANRQLKEKFGVTGYPTVIILNPQGNFVAETGYRPGGGRAYADYLMQLMQ